VSARRAAFVAAWAALVLVATVAPAAASGPGLAAVRAATARYHDPVAAAADGYAPLLECIDADGVGGMGQHLAATPFDGAVDALRPEALVYEVRGDRLQLVGVEYIVPQVEWTGDHPPSLFGQHFHRNDALGIWALHAWVWRPNPSGMFEDFNPNVRMCP
jgi:hypothetical protein